MEIYIDVITLRDWEGKARDYNCVCHYTTDDRDNLDNDVLRKMKQDIETIVNNSIHDAQNDKRIWKLSDNQKTGD